MSQFSRTTGQINYFDNPYSNNVYIDPVEGKTLYINGTTSGNVSGAVDPNTSVQFNNSGNFDGDSSFVYANSTLSVPNVNTNLVEKIVSSDSLNYNQIYNGPGPFPATVGSTHTATNFNFAYDVEVSMDELNDTIVFACPNYILGGSTGGVDVFTRSGTVFNEISPSSLTYSNFTLEATTSSVSISDDGLYISMPDNSQDGWVYLFKNTAGTWALLTDNMDIVRHQAKISMTLPTLITMLSVDRSSIFSITEIDLAGTFGTPVTIFNALGVVPNEGYLPMAIHQYFCMINVGGNSKYYQRIAGVWTLIDTISGAVNECDICSISQTHYVSVYSRTSGGLVIKTSYGTQTFTGNYGAVTCNDSRIFAYSADNSEIQIYNIQNDQSFVKSVNNTAITGVNKMSCSYSYLACSQTGDNQATIFKIQEYTNHDVELIKISLDSTTQKVEITSPSGVDISSDLTVSGVIYTTPNVLGATSPELQMSDAGSGLHYDSSTTSVNTLINYTDTFSVSENFVQSHVQHRSVAGSASSPGYSYIGDTDTGMYRIGANNLGLSLNGIKQVDYATTGTTFTNKISVPVGSVSSPSVSVGSADTGIFKNTNTLSLVTDGVTRLGADFLHIVPTVPIRPLNSGTAATPSYSFVNYQDAGMYASATGVDISVAGVRQFEVSSGGYTRCDSFTGLSTQTNFLNMGGSTISLLNSGETKVQYGQGGNNAANCSMGHNCSLVSNNSTLGCVLKIESTGIGRVGIEQIITNSSTTFQKFYATTAPVGSISSDGTSTFYNSVSSALLKKDIVPVNTSEELEKVLLLKPCNFKWVSNNKDYSGFIANEVEEAGFSCAVSGTDLPDSNGQINYKTLDQSKLIYALVSSIQELSKQNDLLRADIRSIREEMATFV